MEKTIFTKGNYRFSWFSSDTGNKRLFIENLKTGHCDYPIKYYDMRKVAYDYPEKWPAYIRKMIFNWAVKNMD